VKDSVVVPDALRQKAENLRALHHADRPLVLANAWDAASARLVEDAGFPAVATTSAGIAYAWGFADGEHIKRKQMLESVRRIAAAVTVPVTADVEAGYGPGPEAVARTVRDLISAGAVGLNLEDARGRRRRVLLKAALHAERIFAARAAGSDLGVPVVINARTDVFHAGKPSSKTLAEAVERGNAYLEAGADSVFVPFVRDRETIAELVRGIRGPVNILAVPGSPSVAELWALGVRRISVGAGIARAAYGMARRAARELHEQGTIELITEWALPYDEMQRLFTPQAGT
jgi:2-methylisocitrate lyase-like PEP mutase family enzyme